MDPHFNRLKFRAKNVKNGPKSEKRRKKVKTGSQLGVLNAHKTKKIYPKKGAFFNSFGTEIKKSHADFVERLQGTFGRKLCKDIRAGIGPH